MLGVSEISAHAATEYSFRQLVDCIEDYAIYMLDRTGHITTWNRGAEQITGYTSEQVLSQHFRMLFLPRDIEVGVPTQTMTDALHAGRCAGEGWRRRRNGDPFWASYVLTAMRDADGRHTGFAKVVKDISKRKRKEDAQLALEAASQAENERLHAAAQGSLDAFFICEAVRGPGGELEDFAFTFLNGNVQKMLPFPRELMPGGRLREFLPLDRGHDMFLEYKEVVLTGKPLVREVSVRDDDRGPWMRLQAVKCRDGIAVTATDITEWKRDTKRLLYLAQHDALTGLPNRSCLHERMTDGMRRADQSSSRLAVLMIDLDSFKKINDTLGHASGDAVLKTTASRLTGAVRASDCVIRLGGDEFIVVMPDITYLSNVEICAERILSSLRAPMAIDGRSMCISGSIGVAIYPDDATSVEALLTHADASMYAVKEAGRGDSVELAAPAPLACAADGCRAAAMPPMLRLRRKTCKAARRAPVL